MLPITTPSEASSSLNNGFETKRKSENGEESENIDLSSNVPLQNFANRSDILSSCKSENSEASHLEIEEMKSVSKRQLSNEDVSDMLETKRTKIDDEYDVKIILTKLELEYHKRREVYCDHLVELFFLEQQGNLMDYYNWRKKPSTVGLLHYLRENAVNDQDFEDLKNLKQTLDISSSISSKSSIHQTEIVHSKASAVSVVTTTPITSLASCLSPISTVTSRTMSTVSVSGTSHFVTSSSHCDSSTLPSAEVTKTESDIQSTSTTISSANKTVNKQHSISAVYESSIGSQEQIVERAKQEAYVMQRITDLRKEGLWTAKRLPKVQEPPRAKAHWDYLLEEMMWLSTDFAQERKWKKAAAKKCSKMILKYYQEKDTQAEKSQREEQQRLKKIASNVAKIIREFWTNVEKFVEFRQQTRLEEKRKKALDLHLNFIVDQTEKFSSWLAEGMSRSDCNTNISELTIPYESAPEQNDTDFDPGKMSESDDEETIAKEEAEDDQEDKKTEIELLKRESEMPLQQLIEGYSTDLSGSELKRNSVEVDDDFTVNEEDDDDEETIREQEAFERKCDYLDELEALEKEANIPIETLLEKFGVLDNASERTTTEGEDEIVDSAVNSQYEESEEEYNQSTTEESEPEEIGMQFLINPEADKRNLIEVVSEDGECVNKLSGKPGPSRDITDIAAGAERIQPKGNTLLTTKVVTKIPFLLKHQLREYQHIGLDWLAAMYDRKLNGILADEMGLGKTIQTIALLAHLACDRGIWGPHLIVVPTSVMLNWEMEIKKWCPAFKILTYYGSPKERKQKRQGWTKPNQFHICITSYKLVIQDHQSFRRKKWKYLILDEAQHIKNFKSQRWQMLLNFNTSRRLLLTGTPLQNNLMELWSLMHFLMPNVFASHRDFKDWFVNPVTGMIEGSHEYNEGLIKRLHKVLRPFLLRRLKQEVEKQLPKKYEHVVLCRLSKRQRFLYEEFMNLTKTKETLATGNFLSVINVLMQLRKVCNHPNLFESRPIVSPFAMEGLTYHTASIASSVLDYDPFKHVTLDLLHAKLIQYSYTLSAFAQHRIRKFQSSPKLIEEIDLSPEPPPRVPRGKIRLQIKTTSTPSVSIPVQSKFAIRQSNSAVTRPILSPVSQQFVQLATFPQPVLQNSRFVLLSNASVNNPVKPLTSISGSISVTETNKQPNVTVSTGNVIKKWNITAPLTSVGQSNQLGSHKVPFQIGKLVQTPSGQHILLKPVTTSTSVPTSTTLATTIKPVVVSKAQTSSAQKVDSCSNTKDNAFMEFHKTELKRKCDEERLQKLRFLGIINSSRCSSSALYAPDLISVSSIERAITSNSFRSTFNNGEGYFHCLNCHNNSHNRDYFECTETLRSIIKTPEKLLNEIRETIDRFVFVIPPVSSPRIRMHVSHPKPWKKELLNTFETEIHRNLSPRCQILHPIVSHLRTQFPELRLIQYDCGKLQTLDSLLWNLRSGGHRVLIFTQMSRMLDIFEQFLNYHGHTYLRLDGSTKIEQRQALMERFNADKRIFCFILSTRSGGIGVNLTGADTVIFYDSDWNPTMDAQAQDRCHRIGQTRDVHIYRLISEKTIEENILKKAQQKRLLGDVAIEGGNFTTAFFKRNTIRELFGIDVAHDLVSYGGDSEDIYSVPEESHLELELEQALEEAEEAQDIAAAKTARAEAAAEYAEFDETIPIDNDTRDSDERSPEEKEMDKMLEQLSPVERYAMQFLESIQEPIQAEQLKQAEEEIEAHKKEWELGHLKSLKENEERTAADNESDKEDVLTMSREEAYSQVFVSYTGFEQMPTWAPPTPPQDENDLYIDYSIGFLYEKSVMPESQLPPVYIPKDAKRIKLDSNALVRNKQNKTRKEDMINIPRSLFDRPSAVLQKLRKEIKVMKMRGVIVGGPEPSQLQKLMVSIGSNAPLPQPTTLTQQAAASKSPHLIMQGLQQESHSPWAIFEDWIVLHVIQYLQEIPVNLMTLSVGHIPNWDLVSDALNSVTCSYRSAKMCRHHYESIILQREEGKLIYDPSNKKAKKQQKNTQSGSAPSVPVLSTSGTKNRVTKTSNLFIQDGNCSFSQMCSSRFDTIKQISTKRTPTLKPLFISPTGKNQKHIALLQESGINYEQPLTPVQVAANRAERIAKEKAKNQQLQQDQVRQQRQQVLQIKPQPGQLKTALSNSPLQPAQQQFQQAIQAKVAALSQNSGNTPKTTTGFISGISSASVLQQQSANQQVANLAKALSQAAASFTSNNQSPMSPILPEGTRITPAAGSGTVTIPGGVQEIQQQSASNQATGTVISVSALPQQTPQKIVAAAIAPSNQITAHISTTAKLTPAQLQAYRQQVLLRQQQQQHSSRQFQAQSVTQQIQIQPTQQVTPQIQLQPVATQPQVQRLQFSGSIGSQQSTSQQSQSLIASSVKPVTAATVMTSGGLPVAVPLASSQQQRIFTTTKPQQVNIARTTVTEAELAQILTRNQRNQGAVSQSSQQNKGPVQQGITPAQLLQLQQAVQQQVVTQPTLQQNQANTLLSQSTCQVSQQQLLQSPVTLVKTVSAPSTVTSASQTVTIPVSAVTMAGVNILTSQVGGKVGITTTASSGSSAISAQLKQLQLINPQRRIHLQAAQQQVHSGQHQITQVTSSQAAVGTQSQQKIAAIVGQGKTLTQIPGGLGTFQIVHQPTGAATQGQTAKALPTPVTVQQLQQVIKGGLMLPHNLSHTIHVTQGTSATGTTAQLIPQSLLQAMTQNKLQQSSGSSDVCTSQATVSSSPITVTQISASNQSIKHIQVVSTSQTSSQSASTSKNIVIGGQSAQAILQAASLQQSQPQTLTFAIRTSAAPQNQLQTQSQHSSTLSVSNSNSIPEISKLSESDSKKESSSTVVCETIASDSNGAQSLSGRLQNASSKQSQ